MELHGVGGLHANSQFGSSRSCDCTPIDSAPWPLGQEDITLSEWWAHMTCNTGVWGSKPCRTNLDDNH